MVSTDSFVFFQAEATKRFKYLLFFEACFFPQAIRNYDVVLDQCVLDQLWICDQVSSIVNHLCERAPSSFFNIAHPNVQFDCLICFLDSVCGVKIFLLIGVFFELFGTFEQV